MEILITKTQALEISRALITGEKARSDYGHLALQESATVIGNMLELDAVEQELMTPKGLEPTKETKPLTIANLERKN
jgi:hypothetical protein